MAASTLALVNPALLAWAREQSGFEPEPVAKRLSVKTDRVLAWERGERQPTVRQVAALAKVYHRPFGLFFLPQPPELPPLAAEYRRLPGVRPGIESPELRLALRTMLYRRETATELAEELGNSLPSFQLTAHLTEDPNAVGARLRAALGVSIEEQLAWKDEWQAWSRWRDAVESVGALVFQFPKVPLSEVRGVSLFVFPTPAIGVNSRESAPGARVYTLAHELIHLALAVAHEERPALHETRTASHWAQLERFAEEAASALIIPGETLTLMFGQWSVARDAWTLDQVRLLARRFKVTPLALATRLRAEGHFTWAGYERWRRGWTKYVQSLTPRSGGFASPIEKALGRAGRPLSQLVVEAMDANRITAVQASRYLDLRFDHFEGLRSELLERAASPAGTDSES
ncbi:MAG: ImmA/IrrE family metallo-endopeptidase [Gemmatimonadales bacterium]